jgi:hypothetical protein
MYFTLPPAQEEYVSRSLVRGHVTPLTKIERRNRGYRDTEIDSAQGHPLTARQFLT